MIEILDTTLREGEQTPYVNFMPDEKLADELQTTRNKHVIMIRRLFYTEGAPVAYDVKYLLYSKGMPIVEKEIEQATFQEMVSSSMPNSTGAKAWATRAGTISRPWRMP